MNTNTIASLDIGDYYTKLVIGSYYEDKTNILFAKKVITKGIVNGDVISKAEATATINSLLVEAEHIGLPVDELILVLPNKTLNVYRKKANISLPYNSSKQITQQEINSLKEACMKHKIQQSDIVIGIEDILYSLDGRSFDRKPPIGFNGNSISLDAYIYTIKESILNGINDILEEQHVRISNVVINSVASSYLVLSNEMRKSGVFIVDIGATGNSISYFKDNLFSDFKEGKIGGNYLTKSIATSLDIDLDEAELVKTRYGNAKKDNTSKIDIYRSNSGRVLSEESIANACEFAVSNLINDIKHTLDLMLVNNTSSYPLVIVGGTSNLYNLSNKLKEGLDNEIVIRHKSTYGARNNCYIACVGAIAYCAKKGER